jgi:hypothetical protein
MKIRLRDFYDWQLPKWGRYRYFGDRKHIWCFGRVLIDWT